MQPDVEAYWLQAERNLARARGDLTQGFYDGCVANSQQAAELALKALIVHVAGAPARRTHDLAILEAGLRTNGVSAPSSVVAAIGGLPEQTWIRARYPDPATNYVPARDMVESEGRQALANAEAICKWVQQQLSSSPSTGTSSSGSVTQ